MFRYFVFCRQFITFVFSKQLLNMSDRPKVSVIVPVYRTEATLQRTIDSVLRQTLQDFEMIIVDDGTPDGAGAIADRAAAADPRVKVVHQENRGAAEARKSGQREATGEYHMHLDSDDTLAPDGLRVMYDFAVEEDLDVVYPGFTRIIGERRYPIAPRPGRSVVSPREMVDLMLDQSFQYIATMCFSRHELWNDPDALFPPSTVRLPSEDIVANFRLVLASRRVGLTDAEVYEYYFNPNSLTAQGTFYTQELIHALFDELEPSLAAAGLLPEVSHALDEMKLHYVGFYAREVDPGDPWVARLRAIPKSELRPKYKVLQTLLCNNTLRRTAIGANRLVKRLLGRL